MADYKQDSKKKKKGLSLPLSSFSLQHKITTLHQKFSFCPAPCFASTNQDGCFIKQMHGVWWWGNGKMEEA